MPAKDKLIRRLQGVTIFRFKTTGLDTTVAAARTAGQTTITPADVTGLVAGKSLQYGTGEDIERVEVQGVAGGVVTLVKPLVRDHAADSILREQIGYDVGSTKGSVNVTQALEVQDVISSMQRLVFQRIEGYEDFGVEFTIHGHTLYLLAFALGIPLSRIFGDGTAIATPLSLATDFNDIDTESDVCIAFTSVLQDGTVKTMEFWGVYADYTGFAAQLAIGQDGATPMKFKVFGMGIEQDGAPTFTADTTKRATKGKVFGELSSVGMYVAHATPAATTVAANAAADANTLVLADSTNYAAGDWILVDVEGDLEIHWVDAVDGGTDTLTLRTRLLRAQAIGVTVSRLDRLTFAAISADGAKIAVAGQTTAIKSGLRRLPLGAQPGTVDVSLALALSELTLANRAYALGIDQSEIDGPNARLILSEKMGRATVYGAFVQGLLKDGTVNIFNLWSPVQDLANIATQFGDVNGSTIPWTGKATSGVQMIQYAA